MRKKCTHCKRELPIEKFSIDKRKRDGRSSWCKDCVNEYARRYYLNHREERLRYAKEYRIVQKGEREEEIIINLIGKILKEKGKFREDTD